MFSKFYRCFSPSKLNSFSVGNVIGAVNYKNCGLNFGRNQVTVWHRNFGDIKSNFRGFTTNYVIIKNSQQ